MLYNTHTKYNMEYIGKSTISFLICVVCKINCAGGMKLSRFSTVFLVAWLVGTCFGAVAKKKSSPKKAVVDEEGANKRLKSLEEKIRAGTMVSLTDGNFTKFVIDRPREYGSLLMFTATDPKYQCSVCMKVKNNFDEISKMYNAQYNFSQVPSSQKIAFFRLEVDTARSIFSDLGLETVPRMYYLPPAPSSSLKQNLEDLEVDSRPFMEGIYGALNHINEFAKVEVNVVNLANCCFNVRTQDSHFVEPHPNLVSFGVVFTAMFFICQYRVL